MAARLRLGIGSGDAGSDGEEALEADLQAHRSDRTSASAAKVAQTTRSEDRTPA